MIIRAFVGLCVMLVGCSTGTTPTADPSSPPIRSTPTPTAALLDEVDLAAIVLDPQSPPAGLGLDLLEESPLAVASRPVLAHPGRELPPVLDQPGFVAGRFVQFSGEPGGLLSWAMLFDTIDNATRSYELYLGEFTSPEAYGFEALPASLGDIGVCDEGDFVLDVETGFLLHETICLWREANAVLAAGGYIEDSQVRAVAAGMDERAQRALDD